MDGAEFDCFDEDDGPELVQACSSAPVCLLRRVFNIKAPRTELFLRAIRDPVRRWHHDQVLSALWPTAPPQAA